MLPYFIFLAVVLLLAYLSFKRNSPGKFFKRIRLDKSRNRNSPNKSFKRIRLYKPFRRNRLNKVFVVLLFLVMTCFAGFRSSVVGTDTSGYAGHYEDASFEDRDLGTGLAMLTEEPGFYYLEKWLGGISNDYIVLLTGIAAIFCFFVLRSISRNSTMPVLSLFVFITLGYYTFVFNAARQGIAMAIYMTAIPFLIQKRFWPYTLIVLCAAMFHKTVVVAIPLYFVFRMKYSWKSMLIVIGGGLLVGYQLPNLLSFSSTLEDRYLLYTVGSATGGYMLTLFYVILSLFFILQRRNINKKSLNRYDIFLHMLVVGSVVYIVVILTKSYVELTRFAAYFQTACVFLWAMLVRERRTPLSPLVYVVAVVGHLSYFAIFLSQMARLTPYLWNPNLFG